MIDRVEFDVLDQLEQMGKFDRHGAFGLEQQRDAGDEVVQPRHVREHVVADDQIGRAALDGELSRQRRRRRIPPTSARRSSRAAPATVSDGSMPSTGMPMSTKFFSR